MAFTIEDEILVHKSLHDMSDYDYAMKVKFVYSCNRVKVDIDFVDKHDNVILSRGKAFQFYIYTFLSDLSQALNKRISFRDEIHKELDSIDTLINLYNHDFTNFTYNFDYGDSIHIVENLGKLCISYVIESDDSLVNSTNIELDEVCRQTVYNAREINNEILDLLRI